jgi:hypothetical protein
LAEFFDNRIRAEHVVFVCAQRLERLVGCAGKAAFRLPLLAAVQDQPIGRWGSQFWIEITEENGIRACSGISVEQKARHCGIGIADEVADRFTARAEYFEVPSIGLREAVVVESDVVALGLFGRFQWNEESTAVRPLAWGAFGVEWSKKEQSEEREERA